MVDGLPIRQWRLQKTTVGADHSLGGIEDPTVGGPGGWPELPMPRGSEHYAPWCQQLLRVARAGRKHKTVGGSVTRAATNGGEEEDKEKDMEPNGREDVAGKNGQRPIKTGITAIRWAQLPRHMEEPEKEYLAKRRKGLPSIHARWSGAVGWVSANTGQMRKTKVRREDAEGRIYVWEVLVPEGQAVRGEITKDITMESAGTAITATAPGTVVEGLGVANEEGILVATAVMAAPPRRRAPPPRRKPKKGPGRGGKKLIDTDGQGVSASAEALKARKNRVRESVDIKHEIPEETEAEDTTMQEKPEVEEDEEDGDDDGEEAGEVEEDEDIEEVEEDDEDIEEVEEDDENDREEGELSPSPEEEQDVAALLSKFRKPAGNHVLPAAPKQNLPQHKLNHAPYNKGLASLPELLVAPRALSGHGPLRKATEPMASTAPVPTVIRHPDHSVGISPAINHSLEGHIDKDVHFEDGDVDLIASMDQQGEISHVERLVE